MSCKGPVYYRICPGCFLQSHRSVQGQILALVTYLNTIIFHVVVPSKCQTTFINASECPALVTGLAGVTGLVRATVR